MNTQTSASQQAFETIYDYMELLDRVYDDDKQRSEVERILNILEAKHPVEYAEVQESLFCKHHDI